VKRDDPNGQVFAAKMFRRGYNGAAAAEIESGEHLDHPRVSKVYETFVGDDSSSTVLILRLMMGQELAKKARAIKEELNGKMFPKSRS
jgi:hypothetical protein